MSPGNELVNITKSPAALVSQLGQGSWHLEIPANTRGGYRLAQLDDHGLLQRRNFPWRAPLKLSLQARLSSQELPGTWGFGLWNDPFSFLLNYNRIVFRFPTLPEAAWFFHASPHNYLSFRDDLPANGFLAATFSSKKVATAWLALLSPILALALIPKTAPPIRRALRRLIRQDTRQVYTNVTAWHAYRMDWEVDQVRFFLDGVEILHTNVAPNGPLSLVIWIDNQYAALLPSGRLRYGTLPNPEPAWMELRELSLEEKA
jgi:hypothetical protein